MADKENGKPAPPDVLPPYIAIAKDHTTRAVGIQRAIETYSADPVEVLLFGAEMHRLNASLEENQFLCDIGQSEAGCINAADLEHEIGLYFQEADKRRVQSQQFPTILSEFTFVSSGVNGNYNRSGEFNLSVKNN